MPRRLVATAPHVIEVEEFTPKPLPPTRLRVRTELASGKHGTVTAMFDGRNFEGQAFDPDLRLFRPAPQAPGRARPKPSVIGTTGVGVVIEVGRKVTRFAPGDRVIGLMGVSELNQVEEANAWHLGAADPLEALCVEPAYVAFHAVREAGLRFGDTVAVHGLGAIGLVAVQMARRAGAARVIAVDPLARRRDWAAAHGADAVIDPLAEDAPLRVRALTGGAGVDVAIEAAGSYAALEAALKSARVGGTVSAAGFYQGEARGVWLGREMHHNRLTLVVPHGCGWGHEPRDFPRWSHGRTYATLVAMLQERRLDLGGLIHPLVSLDEAPGVWRRIEAAPGEVLKFGVRFDAADARPPALPGQAPNQTPATKGPTP